VIKISKTIKVGELANPKIRVRFGKNGKMGFIKVGEGNPNAIKGQQGVLSQCAKSSAGLKGAAFKAKMKTCMKR
jgi:hypothetical protein